MHLPAQKQVSLPQKILWGAGGLADNFMFNVLITLGMLIYVDFFRMSPALAGIAIFVPRFVDAITDPWIGNLSDNLVTRWGRRKPLIFLGTILSAIFLPLLWTPPFMESVQNPWYSNVPFLYLCTIGSLLAVSYTLFVVPYTALGFEMSSDYDERTSIISWRMYIGLLGSLACGWLYKLSTLSIFPNEGVGVVWVSLGVAVIVLFSGILPIFSTKENLSVQAQEKINLLSAVKYTLGNKPFQIIFVAYLIVVIAIFATAGILPFVLIYGVLEGDKGSFGTLNGWLITVAVTCSYISVILINWVSQKTSKGFAMIIGLGLACAGNALHWFTINPHYPYAILLSSLVAYLGLQGCWLMVDSMVADICDADEIETGRRREGMFSAVKGFAVKLAQAITAAIGGALLAWSGFDPDQANESGITDETFLKLKILVVGLTCAGLLIAIWAMKFYPITREQAEKNRQKMLTSAK